MNIENEQVEIVYVDTDDLLASLANTLATKREFGFDTEFDRFWREYGFKLFLLQIFDGEKCYIVDPLSFKNLQPLWQVFEDRTICKVAYACIEDVQLLKLNGCNPINIFDLQVAAKLCNHTGNSFSDLVLEQFNKTVDKTYQRSNWRRRPLEPAQLVYASNDVIWLLTLKKYFVDIAINTNVMEMLEEENLLFEDTVVTEYVVKLSSKQMGFFSPYHQNVLLEFFHIRNEIGAAYNIPPASVVNDSVLEAIVESRDDFYRFGFGTGFCKQIQTDEKAQQKFIIAIENIDTTIPNIPLRAKRLPAYESFEKREARKEKANEDCKILNDNITGKYGVIAGEYILRGVKKALQARPYEEIELRKYQNKVIDETCKTIGIVL
jgi:ribonuclease D